MSLVIDISTGKPVTPRRERRFAYKGMVWYHLRCVGFGEDGHPLWDCACGTKAKRIELKNLREGRGGTVSCGCVKKKNVKAIYEGLVYGLSADMLREAYRLVGAGRHDSTYEWQTKAARDLRAKDRLTVDSNVLSFAAHKHRDHFIAMQGTEGLESISKTAKGSRRGFFNLQRRGLNRAEIFLAMRETRKTLNEQAAAEAEERRIDRDKLQAELAELMEKVADPALRALGAESLADEIVKALHHVAERVAHRRGGWGFNTAELPTPGSKAYEKSKKRLVWVYKLLAQLNDDDRNAYVQISKLWKILKDALRQREIRKQSMMALMRIGVMPALSDYKAVDWLSLGPAPRGLAPDVAAGIFSVTLNGDIASAA